MRPTLLLIICDKCGEPFTPNDTVTNYLDRCPVCRYNTVDITIRKHQMKLAKSDPRPIYRRIQDAQI